MTDQVPVSAIIMYPDFEGKATDPDKGREFHLGLLAVQPDALIVPVLNGPDRAKLTNLMWEMRKHNSHVIPVCCFEPGLLNALVAGYRGVLDIVRLRKLGDLPVVRLDTAEHNPAAMGSLIALASQISGLVVGDLEFDDTTLIPDTADHLAHTREWPRMTCAATGGKIWLSCAHGYLAFGPGVLPRVFDALCQMKLVTTASSGEAPRWGLDLAMVLTAVGEKIPVERLPVRATVLRNRSAEKIDQQRVAARRWIDAAYRQYPLLNH